MELDAAYKQEYYEPLLSRVNNRLASNSDAARARIGEPQRVAYGPTEIETLDIYRTDRGRKAPIFVFIHGGIWIYGSARNSGYAAELFVNAGAHFIALDFSSVKRTGDLGLLAKQVRGAIAWVYQNASSFDGDPERLYIGGHSSGGHLCGVALVTDWQNDFGLPANIVKGGLCMSGMFDMKPVRLSWRRSYINFTDGMEDAASPQRHIDKLNAPVIVTYGTFETPEFQRQSRDFSAAVKAAGKPVD